MTGTSIGEPLRIGGARLDALSRAEPYRGADTR